ncbi:hypothetical protein HanIR_Chr09g0441541 [Helianthus annuus]|nr:hypothetical protein HanIR_Chr09g0441541 [Helianthus annuus]
MHFLKLVIPQLEVFTVCPTTNNQTIERINYYLHNANTSSTVIRKITDSNNNISRVKKRLRVCGHEHKQAHDQNMRSLNNSYDR